MAKNNYKAKWLKAINESDDTLQDKRISSKTTVEELNNGQFNTAASIKRIRDPMLEAAANCRSLINIMDECKVIGTHEFAETTLQLDSKLSQMDLVTIARRVRDTLKIATARIGMMSAALEDAYETVSEYEGMVKSLKPFAEDTEKTLTELFMIGKAPTEREKLDLENVLKRGDEYSRFGLQYEDMQDDDWTITPLIKKSVLRESKQSPDLKSPFQYTTDTAEFDFDEEEDDEDEEEDEIEEQRDQQLVKSGAHQRKDSAIGLTHNRNRSAQIIPVNSLTLEDELLRS